MHKLTDKDTENRVAFCLGCNSQVSITLHNRKGKASYWRCAPKHSSNSKPSNHKYRSHVKESCEACGFIPVDICQLDVDHIDGNHHNNSIDNLQTLCANCHRLKTKINKEGMYK